MARTYTKNILRTFKSTRSRFIAIFSIVALGVGFLAGLNATPIDMVESMEKYMDDGNFYDIRIVSTLGLTDEDVTALEAVDGVETVQPAYSADLLVGVGDDVVVSRAHSLPPDTDDAINRLNLVEGRMPQASGECVVEGGSNAVAAKYPVGTRLVVSDENEDLDSKLAVTEYTVVGIVHNSNYFSFEREPASVGNGSVKLVMYLMPGDFSYEAYTELYVTASGALAQNSLDGDEYQATVDAVKDNIEAIQDERCQARYDGIRADAQKEIDDAWAEYYDAKEEAETELADAAQELADGKKELADGEKEYQDGEQEYADGLAELTANESKIYDGIAQLADAEQQLRDAEQQLADGEAELAANEPKLAEAKQKLEDGQAQYEQGLQQYNDGLAQVEAGEATLAESKAQLDAGWAEYYAGIDTLVEQVNSAVPGLNLTSEQVQGFVQWLVDSGYEAPTTVDELLARLQEQGTITIPSFSLTDEQAQTAKDVAGKLSEQIDIDALPEGISDEQKQKLSEAKARLETIQSADTPEAVSAAVQDALTWVQGEIKLPEEVKTQITEALQAWMDAHPDQTEAIKNQLQPLVEGVAQIVNGYRQLRDGQAAYDAGAQQLADARAQLEAGKPQLDAAKQQLDEGWRQYNEGLAEYEAGKRQLAAARKTINDGWATLADKQLELADAQRQIADAKAQLASARKTLDDARATIAENRQKLLDGEIDYEDAKAEVDKKLADAKAEIEDGEKQLDDIEMPEWYVWDRTKNVSYASFTANVDKLKAITTIFPLFFFLVAALVVSTTMTRMVEEERLQIGTLKALGYSRRTIMKKYLWYAFAASVAGTFVGLAVGFKAFPTIIWSAYEMMYYMPSIATPWRLAQALFAGGTLIALSVGVTAFTCRRSLGEVPAALMLPRAPKAGKRIILERITPLWKRLPFTWKVTCRNLLRYKKRFWMTVVGVMGCTSLLVAGFGISDSLNAIITKQYEDVYHYDLMTIVTRQETLESGAVHDYLYNNTDVFSQSLTVSVEATRQDTQDGEADVYLLVPQDIDAFADFADLHERISRKATPLGEQGVVLTEKLAKTLGVKAGDTVTLKNADEETGTFTVTGVCEHYVSNYVYMSAATYAAGFGEEPTYNAALSQMPDDSQAVRDEASSALLGMDNVASLTFTQDSVTQVLNMLNSIDAVVVLIIVCAACLAFVVLYNLSNINIAERVKEIATIKVLGFYDREVDAYVNRESVALTLIGILFGMFGGKALHTFIINTVEVDAVMFGRQIDVSSYLYAVALTLLFSLIVNAVMGRQLKRISMVESMKAPE